jgi:hypothetical protein
VADKPSEQAACWREMYCPKFCKKSTESAALHSSYYAFTNCQYHSLVSCTTFVLHHQVPMFWIGTSVTVAQAVLFSRLLGEEAASFQWWCWWTATSSHTVLKRA